MRTRVKSAEPDTLSSDERYARSLAEFAQARTVLAGGVNSNFRAGGEPAPLFFARGVGAHLYDVDGNDFIDYALGMGPVILGHAQPAVTAAVEQSLAAGVLYAGQHHLEVELGRLLQQFVPSAQRVRVGSSGSEMAQLAVRLARAATGRPQIVKFEGHYHGWLDNIYVGVGRRDAMLSRQSVVQRGQVLPPTGELTVLPWNDLEVVERHLLSQGTRVAALIMEPILCNTGTILPKPGYLEGVRALCARAGALLIFDEVITGFRVDLGGAQQLLGVLPDLTILGKAMANGFPIAALVGRAEIMDLIATAGVVHGGTYNGNVVSVAAAVATLNTLAADQGAAYRAIRASGQRLIELVRKTAASGDPALRVQGIGPVFNIYFGPLASLSNAADYETTDADRLNRFHRRLQDRGVRPTSRGTWFLSTGHSDADIEATIDAVGAAIDEIS